MRPPCSYRLSRRGALLHECRVEDNRSGSQSLDRGAHFLSLNTKGNVTSTTSVAGRNCQACTWLRTHSLTGGSCSVSSVTSAFATAPAEISTVIATLP